MVAVQCLQKAEIWPGSETEQEFGTASVDGCLMAAAANVAAASSAPAVAEIVVAMTSGTALSSPWEQPAGFGMPGQHPHRLVFERALSQ